MNGAKYAMAMLAAGGAVGAAAQASAATTVNLDIPYIQPFTKITLVGSHPQFGYGHPFNSLETDFDAYGSAEINSFPFPTDPGLPGAGQTYNSQSVKTASFSCGGPCDTGYFQLKFDNSAGDHYVGTAYVDNVATLETITYDKAPFAVPEPDAWALLIVGFGATGAVMRRNRRRSQAAMA